MAKFDGSFWNRIQNLIKLYHLNFLFDTIGGDFLSEEEMDFLETNLGKTRLNRENTPLLDKIFAFGKVAEKVGRENADKITVKDLEKFIKDNGTELKEELDKIKQQAYIDILGKQFHIERDLRQEILNQSQKEDFKISDVYKFIKDRFENWSNLQESISYISENSLNAGKIAEIKEKSDENDPLVYKVPILDEKLCPNCRRLYLNNDGSPKLFKLSELEGNGTNIGLKPRDWKATLGVVHPRCRCLLQYFETLPNTTTKDYEWNDSAQRYILKEEVVKDDSRKVQRKSKVKITIGDKNFEV